MSTLGNCNAYLNMGHAVGVFYEWPDCFYSGANRNVSDKTRYEIGYSVREVENTIDD